MKQTIRPRRSNHPGRIPFRHSSVVLLITFWSCASPLVARAQAESLAQVQFNDLMLMKPRGQSIDVSRFSRGNPVSPGNYTVDVYRNGDWIGHLGVRFVTPEAGDSAVPCIDRALARRLGLDMHALAKSAAAVVAELDAGQCVSLGRLVPGATNTFDLADLRLDLSVPQIALERHPSDYVSPELWDDGVPSATLAYDLNMFRATAGGFSHHQTWLGLNGGANFGKWHFRTNSSFMSQTWGGSHFQNIATYLQRELPSLRSQLTIGDSFTDGALFDSIGIRGVQLATDDRMLPDSMRGYAPVIRGIAMSNARVTVTQNGNRIYETNVAPGPFSIDDLYATGYGGSLVVTVTEADGSERTFTVPYASVVQLLRPGMSRVNVVLGQVRDAQLSRHENIFQGTVQYGVNNLLTAYAGTTVAHGYVAGLAGSALNTPLGAVALDFTLANATIPGHMNTSGQSLRLSYSKMLPQTGTNVAVAAYRYSSSGFWTLRDSLLAREAAARGVSASLFDRQRNQFQVTLNQSLGDKWGNLYAVGSTQSYWNRHGSDTQFQVGYNNSLSVGGYRIGYNLSASRERDAYSGNMATQLFASVTLPLGRGRHAPMLSTNFAHSNSGGWTEQATLTGTAGEYNQFTYGVNGSHTNDFSSAGVNAQYRGQNGTVSASASSGSGYSQVSGGLSGALVLHPGALSLANSLSDTIGVVDAKGATGAAIENWPGVRVNNHGYAVLPFLNPYHLNTVQLSPKGLPLDVELDETSQQVAPRAGSVAMVRFRASIGRAALLTIRRPDGSPVPFGADVLDANGAIVATVAQGGRAYLRGLPDVGAYTVRWGSARVDRCSFRYALPARGDSKSPYATVDAACDDASESASASSAPPPNEPGDPDGAAVESR